MAVGHITAATPLTAQACGGRKLSRRPAREIFPSPGGRPALAGRAGTA
ncbi:hypothetical protein RA210_U30347 [Rubrivivax sp. A210]|nr:hypothetical protein RA210_U30347 [Rubrivivax sp. A210]